MPVGSWWSTGSGGGGTGNRTPGGFGNGSLTGPGPASQPKSTGQALLGPAPTPVGGQQAPGTTYTQSLPTTQTRGLNPNIGTWAMDALEVARSRPSSALAQQSVGPNPLGGVRSLLDTFYGPQSSLLDQTLARQQDQLGMVGIEADYRRGALNRDTDLSRRGLDIDRSDIGLDRQALGIERGAISGNLANLDKLKEILGKRYGLAGEDLDNKLAQLGIDEAKLKDMAGRQKFDLRSNLTARGAFNTVANDRGTGRIDRDLIYGLGGINNQRRQLDINHRGTILGLDEQGIGYDNQGIALNARLANIGVDSGRLDNALARVGLKEEQLGNALQDGLRAIGLDEYTTVNGLLDAIGGTNAQQAELARTVLGELMGYAGLPPEVLAEITAALGVPAPGTRDPATYAGPSYRR